MQAPSPHPHPTKCSRTTSLHPAGNGSLCQTAPRMSAYSLMDPGYGANANGNYLGSLVLQHRCIKFLGLLTLLFIWTFSGLGHIYGICFPLGLLLRALYFSLASILQSQLLG